MMDLNLLVSKIIYIRNMLKAYCSDFLLLLSVSTCVNVDFINLNNLTPNMKIGPKVQLNIDFDLNLTM